MDILTRSKGKTLIIVLLFIINIFASFKMLYAISLLTGIETFIRLLVSIIIIIILSGFIVTYYRYLKKYGSKYFKLIPITLVYVIVLVMVSGYIIKTYKSIKNLSNNLTVYSTSLVSLSENKSTKISNLSKGKIGMIDDYTSIDGNEIPKEIIKGENLKNKIVTYNGYENLLDALFNKEIEYAFFPTTYSLKFKNINDSYDNLDKTTKIIYTREKQVKQTLSSKNISKEPFSILIMGVDSKTTNLKNSVFNGDALMLLTFNPKTLNATIMSIPRDSYVPIACFKNVARNKITHAAMHGENCMINTIENFTDIDIDYYVKINFKGVVNIIDSLGGIEVDVPYSFCEQDSNRKWGKNTIYVEEGLQKLNGEQALALSRNRKNNTSKCSSKWTGGYRSDFVRGENQQLVLRALINKLKDVDSIDKINKLLDTVSMSMETNLSTNQIFSLYNIGKDILIKSNDSKLDDLIGFEKLHLSGYDAYIYDERTSLNLYNYVLYQGSIKDVSDAMKINLGLKKPKLIKKFSFDINEEYEKKVIGNGDYESEKLPSFVGLTEIEAKKKAKILGLKVKIKYLKSIDTYNTVIYQNYSAGTTLYNVDELILTIATNE